MAILKGVTDEQTYRRAKILYVDCCYCHVQSAPQISSKSIKEFLSYDHFPFFTKWLLAAILDIGFRCKNFINCCYCHVQSAPQISSKLIKEFLSYDHFHFLQNGCWQPSWISDFAAKNFIKCCYCHVQSAPQISSKSIKEFLSYDNFPFLITKWMLAAILDIGFR